MENERLKDKIFKIISNCAAEIGRDSYVTGGYVRDLFLNRPSKDIDVVVVGSGIELASSVAKALGKGAYLSVFKNFGTAQVKKGDLEVEFVGARKESYQRDSRKPIVEDGTLDDDQKRRDFTVNALALSLNKSNYGELLDPFNGMMDMQCKILRTPLDPDITFSDDPLRMMRAIRFATQLDFYIEESTFEAIARNKERIKIVSGERIIDEMNKMILSNHPAQGFRLLSDAGLLEIIFPEMEALKGIDTKEGKQHKDIFEHTLGVLEHVAANSKDLWMRWAAVMHDIGKPATKRFDKQNGWTFYNHNIIGSRMVQSLFRRLKLPMNEHMKFVKKMVYLHMRPIALSEEEITDAAIRRLLFEAGDDIDNLMMLCEADITSRNAEKVKRFKSNFALVRQKLKDIEEKDRMRNFQPPISGELIMNTFNLMPCAAVGEIKSAIKDAILDGIIENQYEPAFDFMLKKAKELGIEAPTK